MSQSSPASLTLPAALRQWLLRTLVGWLWMAAAPLLAAGTARWPWFWAYLGVALAGQLLLTLLLLRYSPGLLIERVQRRKDYEAWDRPLVVWAVVVLPLVCLIVSGLDRRFGWTQGIAWTTWLPWLGLALQTLGHALGDWAMLANASFSPLVRIQAERGHKVATGGPYRFVRHPGYVGVMIFQVATPMVLGSTWALAPALIACVIMIVRTGKEDRMLQARLDGYSEYTQRTRWRLLPGVW